MNSAFRFARAIALAVAMVAGLSLPGCSTLKQLAALRQVDFQFDRVSDVRIAGVAVAGRSGYSDLGPVDLGRLAAAVATHSVPLDFVIHVRGTNPASNTVSARMVQLGWSFFVETRHVVDGELRQSYLFEPGRPVDVPLAVHFNAWDKFGGGAKSLFELALAIADVPGYSKEVRADLMPTIDTSLGPIKYPTPITVRRTIGG